MAWPQRSRVLNRIVTWGKHGIGYEADARHVEVILEDLKFNECTIVGTLGTNTEGRTKEDSTEPLSKTEETKYRALVARANDLAPDRSDLASSVKELARAMVQPRRGIG